MASVALVLVVARGAPAGFATEPRASSAAGAAMAYARWGAWCSSRARRLNRVVLYGTSRQISPNWHRDYTSKTAGGRGDSQGSHPKTRRSRKAQTARGGFGYRKKATASSGCWDLSGDGEVIGQRYWCWSGSCNEFGANPGCRHSMSSERAWAVEQDVGVVETQSAAQ